MFSQNKKRESFKTQHTKNLQTMKFFTANLLSIFLIGSHSFVRSEAAGMAPGMRRLLSAKAKVFDAARNRKMQQYTIEFEIEDLSEYDWCMIESDQVYSDPDLEQALVDMLDSTNIEIMDVRSASMTVNFSDESKKAFQQVCSHVGGYYAEAEKPITCTTIEDGVELFMTYNGMANCAADTVSCKSADILLDNLNSLYDGLFDGGCSYDEDDTPNRALRGSSEEA